MKFTNHFVFFASMLPLVLILCLIHLTAGFKLLSQVTDQSDGDGSNGSRGFRQRRAVPTSEAVLMYSTQDSIFELPFKSVSSHVKEADFRKVFDSNKYTVSAFSATYKQGDNLLMYGKNRIYSRSLRSGPSYIQGEDQALFYFDKHFVVDWVDYNVYTVRDKKLILNSIHSTATKTVNTISQSARNLVIDQVKHFVAWIANDVNIVRINKDGSGEQTVWTEPTGSILCMTADSHRQRFYFFVNGPGEEDEQTVNSAIMYSIDYDSEDKPMREGSLVYQAGSTILYMAKYFEQVFAVILEHDQAGDAHYKLVQVKKSGDQLVEDIMTSQSWPITGLYIAWQYKDQPGHCHKGTSRCMSLCAHKFDDKTPMCLCKDQDSANCKPYLMTPTPPPTRAPITQKGKSKNKAYGYQSSSSSSNIWLWVIVILLIAVVCALAFLAYCYFFGDEEGEGDEEGGMEGSQGGTTEQGSQVGSQTDSQMQGQTSKSVKLNKSKSTSKKSKTIHSGTTSTEGATNFPMAQEPLEQEDEQEPRGWLAQMWYDFKCCLGFSDNEEQEPEQEMQIEGQSSNAIGTMIPSNKKKKNKGKKRSREPSKPGAESVRKSKKSKKRRWEDKVRPQTVPLSMSKGKTWTLKETRQEMDASSAGLSFKEEKKAKRKRKKKSKTPQPEETTLRETTNTVNEDKSEKSEDKKQRIKHHKDLCASLNKLLTEGGQCGEHKKKSKSTKDMKSPLGQPEAVNATPISPIKLEVPTSMDSGSHRESKVAQIEKPVEIAHKKERKSKTPLPSHKHKSPIRPGNESKNPQSSKTPPLIENGASSKKPKTSKPNTRMKQELRKLPIELEAKTNESKDKCQTPIKEEKPKDEKINETQLDLSARIKELIQRSKSRSKAAKDKKPTVDNEESAGAEKMHKRKPRSHSKVVPKGEFTTSNIAEKKKGQRRKPKSKVTSKSSSTSSDTANSMTSTGASTTDNSTVSTSVVNDQSDKSPSSSGIKSAGRRRSKPPRSARAGKGKASKSKGLSGAAIYNHRE